MSPLRAANISGVNPLLSSARTSAPSSISTLAMSGAARPTAHISAVLLVSVVVGVDVRAVGEQRFDDLRLPVWPRSSAASSRSSAPRFGLAPAFSSRSTIAGAGVFAARASGVTPWSSAALTLAPALEQQVDRLEIVPVGGPQQRRAPSSGRAVFTLTPA